MLIEHVKEDGQLIKEMERMCQRGGLIIISTSAFSSLWSEHDDACEHQRRYTIEEFRTLVKDNTSLNIVKLSYYNIVLYFPALIAAYVYRLNKSRVKHTVQRRLWRFPNILNKLLTWIITTDALLTAKNNVPFGVNLIAVLEKPR